MAWSVKVSADLPRRLQQNRLTLSLVVPDKGVDLYQDVARANAEQGGDVGEELYGEGGDAAFDA